MSSDSFGKLMERFGNEAETERQEEARLQAKKIKAAKIKKGIFVVLLLAFAVGCWFNRQVVAEYSRKIYNSTMGITDSVTRNGEETKNKAKELKENAEKRNQVIDEILK